MTTEEIVNLLQNQDYVIYGAGYVASIVYKALKTRKLLGKFQGFVTTKGDSEGIDGHEISPVDSADLKDKLVILAVHESIKNDIQSTLNQYNYDKCIWIYPHLFELMLGKPEKKTVSTKEVYLANKDNYAMAARYMVLEQYYGKRTDGDDLYMAFMELHCSHETALSRLAKFKELIRSFDENGFMNRPISLLEDYKIIDGFHRMVILLHNGIDKVEAFIYPELLKQGEVHEQGGIIYVEDVECMDSYYANELIELNKSMIERYSL